MQEALEIAAAHPGTIDLLLSDVVMPQMAGPEVARRLQRSRPETEILLMSGFAQPILDAGGHLDEGVDADREALLGAEADREGR